MSALARLVERYEAWRYRRTYGRNADHSRALAAARLAALYDEHVKDTCEYEMGACISGCKGECVPWCISDEHDGPVAPEWPCQAILDAEGLSREQFWQREDERLDAAMEVWARENGVTYP